MNKENVESLLKTITADTFSHFLIERQASDKCPICNSRDQIIPQTFEQSVADIDSGKDAHHHVSFYVQKTSSPVESTWDYFYKVFCDNCGYVMTYSVVPVLSWLNKKEKQNKES